MLYVSNLRLYAALGSVDELMEQVRTTPRLREALYGDQDIIMSPCRPPPGETQSEAGYRARKSTEKQRNNWLVSGAPMASAELYIMLTIPCNEQQHFLSIFPNFFHFLF